MNPQGPPRNEPPLSARAAAEGSEARGDAPRTLILRTAGTNCDRELAHAFARAGAAPEIVHLNLLIREPHRLEGYELIGIPGGFSYGDDIAAGRILANYLRHRLLEPLLEALDRGVAVIGICNGFQALVKLGLLPDPRAGAQTATLADNRSGRFVARWVPMHTDAASRCIWTRGLERFALPVAHGEGRFTVADPAQLDLLERNAQLALRYDDGQNPNGSARDIAGICDPTGLVLGLMPHPERFVHPTQPPDWTRRPDALAAATPAGLRFFQNAVAHVRPGAAAIGA